MTWLELSITARESPAEGDEGTPDHLVELRKTTTNMEFAVPLAPPKAKEDVPTEANPPKEVEKPVETEPKVEQHVTPHKVALKYKEPEWGGAKEEANPFFLTVIKNGVQCEQVQLTSSFSVVGE